MTRASGTHATEPIEVLSAFTLPGPVRDCTRLAGGHINASWRVRPEGSEGRSYTLQRLNPHVFPHGQAVMENIRRVVARLSGGPDPRGCRCLRLVPLTSGAWWHTAGDGSLWRLYEFIDGTTTHDAATTPELAEAAARAFGDFARRLSEPPLDLAETLPGFHDTRLRLRQLESAMMRDAVGRAGDVADECARVLDEVALARTIPGALESGAIPRRVAHNDAKLGNVLFIEGTAEPCCVIDLDTVMPGTPLHDFGDLVRSMVSEASEDAEDSAGIHVRPEYYRAIARGFIDGMGRLLTQEEQRMMPDAARSIVLEQAARFLADYLDGDSYYRITDPKQNLRRARVQLALFERLRGSPQVSGTEQSEPGP